MAYSNIKTTEGTGSKSIPDERPRADLWLRLTPLTLSVLTTAISAIPLALHLSDQQYDSNTTLYHLTINHRTSLQVVVGIVSAIFAFLWSLCACSTFNMTTRSRYAYRGAVSLDRLRLGVSISKALPDINLIRLPTLWFGLTSILWFGLGKLPAQLWTGALTPDITLSNQTIPRFLPVSDVAFQHQSLFQHLGYNDVPANGHCDGITLGNGTFHNCPGSVFPGRIVESFRSASTVDNTTRRNHTKLDNSGFNYVGRSYGAGSSAGLFPLPVLGQVESYSFIELGYVVNTTCMYNATSAWSIQNLGRNNRYPIPSIYNATGNRPNDGFNQPGPGVSYAVLSLWGDMARVIAFSAGSSGNHYNGTAPFMLSIATGGQSYALINSTQCELSFRPSWHNVTVSPQNRTIKVTPSDDIPEGQSAVGQGEFLEWTVLNLQSIAQTQTTLFVSTLAEAMFDNIKTKTGSNAGEYNYQLPLDPPNELTLQAVAESVDAAVDDIMEALNAWGLVTPSGSWTYQDAFVSRSVVALGTIGWNIALFAFYVVSLIIIAVTTLVTKCFVKSPKFDFADLPSMMFAAYTAAVTKGQAGLQDPEKEYLEGWRGDPVDEIMSAAYVQLECKPEEKGPPVVFVQEGKSGHEDDGSVEMTHRRKSARSHASDDGTTGTTGGD